MRSFAHWTPRYIVDRARVFFSQRQSPNDPWLTQEAVGLLDRALRPMDVGIEFGSGRSTLWLSQRVAEITNVEDNAEWFQRVSDMLRARGRENVELLYRAHDVEESNGANAGYVRVLDKFADTSIDFVLVDGSYRGHCAILAVPKVKCGGL